VSSQTLRATLDRWMPFHSTEPGDKEATSGGGTM
jgi:hypothetical protein